ncbi:family 1 extracellular solute-binding protein [Neobacillus bataviensis LMG 21833]|uniref:Family 1 extracellular solute-binding protein n=1 Tax=Neobacillus bataviensis LMG 21833 TaxID=1117379 RepID=K6DA97_9BACI|nr:extracellular solute-binding protein [Neobacillus bataviensis]EKN65249.1 family 1 extracellular solute-binding protein [Neobacillus bataviensis LMG 21833]
MLKGKKRKYAYLLMAVMCAIMLSLAGCSSKTNDSASKSEKDKNIKIVMADRGIQAVEASPNISNDKYVKKLGELTNTKLNLELLSWAEYEQNLTLVFAGGEYPDVMEVNGINSPQVAPAVDSGVFMPLNDLIEKHAPNLKKYITQEQWDSPSVSKDGQIYAIPSTNYVRNLSVVMVRKDWMDKLNIETPKTLDEYVEMLRRFKNEDPNGNGEKDEIPWSARENFRYGEAVFGAYDVIPTDWKVVGGKLLPNFIRPEMKEALAVYKELYDEKLLDNEFLVQQGKDWDAKIKGKGNVGMFIHDPTYPDKWLTEIQNNTPSAELEIIPSPTGPDGKGGASILSPVGGMVWAIPASNEDPVSVIKFLDKFYSEDVQTLLTYGLEGDNYTIENGKINYKYPTDQASIQNETIYQNFLRFIGPSHLENEEFLANRPHGDLIKQGIEVSQNEGRKNDGLGMPNPPTILERPELQKDGLWVEFAAKVLTGKESLDNFDKFVEDWKKRGGSKIIDEATEWYKSNKK